MSSTFSSTSNPTNGTALAVLPAPSSFACHWCCFAEMIQTRNEALQRVALEKDADVSEEQPLRPNVVQRQPFFDDLPREVTQQIFDFVISNADIYRSCNRVCRSWYNFISSSQTLFDARLLRSDFDSLERKRDVDAFLKIPGALSRLQSLARKSMGVFSRKGLKLILCEHDTNQPDNLFWQHNIANGHFERHVSPRLRSFFAANRCLYEMPYSFHKVIDTTNRNKKPRTGLFFDCEDGDDERYGNFGHNRGGQGWWTLFNLEQLLAQSDGGDKQQQQEAASLTTELFDVLKIPFAFILAYCYSVPSIFQRAIFYDVNLNRMPRDGRFHFCTNDSDDGSLVVARYPPGLRYVAVPDKILGLRFVPPGHCSIDDDSS